MQGSAGRIFLWCGQARREAIQGPPGAVALWDLEGSHLGAEPTDKAQDVLARRPRIGHSWVPLWVCCWVRR